MGSGASKLQPKRQGVRVHIRAALAMKKKGAAAALERALPEFELSTPMLVMPFAAFKKQGRICKSTKPWRDAALADGSLLVYAEVTGGTGLVTDGVLDGTLIIRLKGKVVIFLSHTWWDRAFKDETNDPNDPYDKGAPDYQTGESKDLKWRVICAVVETLVEEQGLNAEDVLLWCDWQSIYQDDETEKIRGVMSLLKYATLCEYMLVPTAEAALFGSAAQYPECIPGYGARGCARASAPSAHRRVI